VNTDDVIQALRRKYDTSRGNWANIVEFERIDFLAVGCWASTGYDVHGHEIKVSRSDWLRELKKTGKADSQMIRCDYWWLVAPAGVLKDGELPSDWGFMQITESGCRVKVKAPRLRPEPSRSRFIQTDDGSFVYNKEFFDRESFAMLARRYSYAEADRESLMREFKDHPAAQEALDKAAAATGRATTEMREWQKEMQREATRSRRMWKRHTDHTRSGETDADCEVCIAWA
jgi:hypothetical protein